MKKMPILLCFLLLLFLVSCSKVVVAKNYPTDYIIYEDLKESSDTGLLSIFIEKTEENNLCMIRIGNTADGNTISEIEDVTYDGSAFKVNNDGVEKEYKYLNHYEVEVTDPNSDYSRMSCFFLLNDKDLSYNDIEHGLKSSLSTNGVDCYLVYFEMF